MAQVTVAAIDFVESIDVRPNTAELVVGRTAPLSAILRRNNGTSEDATSLTQWVSRDPTVATVPTNGVVRTVAVGMTTVYATYMGVRSNDVAIAVRPAAAMLTIAPAAFTLQPATGCLSHEPSTVQLAATASWADGRTEDVTSRALWTSSALTVAVVGSGPPMPGLVRAGAQAGTTEVNAAFEGAPLAMPATITVAPCLAAVDVRPASATLAVGEVRAFVAQGTYSDARVEDLARYATWASSDPAVVTIDASGTARAIAPGSATLTLTLAAPGGVRETREASVTVLAP